MGMSSLLTAFAAYWRAARVRHVATRELAAMSACQLGDMGITRQCEPFVRATPDAGFGRGAASVAFRLPRIQTETAKGCGHDKLGVTGMSNNIAGKVVVITGASSGLGEATARLLSAQGASVVLGARRQDRIRLLASDLNDGGGKAIAVTMDVTDRAQVKTLVDTAAQAYGRVDVMINNAGLMPQAPLERFKVDEWDRMIDVNLKGVLYGIAAALPYMQQQKSGHFINVSSVAGHKVGPGFAVYAATKHAVWGCVRGLRMEVKPYSIRTTVISPGAVATELPDSITDPDTAARVRNFYAAAAIPADSSPARSPSPSISRRMSTSTKSCSAPRGRKSDRGTSPCRM